MVAQSAPFCSLYRLTSGQKQEVVVYCPAATKRSVLSAKGGKLGALCSIEETLRKTATSAAGTLSPAEGDLVRSFAHPSAGGLEISCNGNDLSQTNYVSEIFYELKYYQTSFIVFLLLQFGQHFCSDLVFEEIFVFI